MTLRARRIADSPAEAWQGEVAPDGLLLGFLEDANYLLQVDSAGAQAYVDDEPLVAASPVTFHWRPALYAGRVTVEIVAPSGAVSSYALVVGPRTDKSEQPAFDAMVARIREFDAALLGGWSAATMVFAATDSPARLERNVLLARVRAHGPAFLDAVARLAYSPHRSLSLQGDVVPLSRVRRLHHAALRDRRLAALATRHESAESPPHAVHLRRLASAPTADTPANHTLLALLRRFGATVMALTDDVREGRLAGSPEDQQTRSARRSSALRVLTERTRQSIKASPFEELSTAWVSSAGLTQIAANPLYARAYRIGCRALALGLGGADGDDFLHVPPSWGIYETWCFLGVFDGATRLAKSAARWLDPKVALADVAAAFDFEDGSRLELLFQPVFPALVPSPRHGRWSLSRERRPDIVLLHRRGAETRVMVLDAKWRSGRSNVLDAMASAHLYHDALRVGASPPSTCLLLLPGASSVFGLETEDFILTHGVGAVSEVRVGARGMDRLQTLLADWLGR